MVIIMIDIQYCIITSYLHSMFYSSHREIFICLYTGALMKKDIKMIIPKFKN